METQSKRAGNFLSSKWETPAPTRRAKIQARLTPMVCGLAASWMMFAGRVAWAQGQATTNAPATNQTEEPDMPPGYPNLDAPWNAGKSKKVPPAPAPAPQSTAPAPVPTPETQALPPAQPPAETTTTAEAAVPAAPKIRKNEISVSGDYFLGQGNVTLPFGFALSAVGVQGTVNKADRTSDYFGGTVSYSYKHNWFIDFAYANGSSSGTVPVALGSGGGYEQLNSSFSIKDDWYQAYLRYTFPSLRGTRWSAYLRAGFSYVQATLNDTAPIPLFGLYEETDKTDDLLGNLGFGVGRSVYASQHFRFGVQVEGEGFYGRRTQKIDEALPNDPGLVLQPTTINNDLYGGIGRGTVRFEYRPGRSGAVTIFADGGIQAKYTLINYPSGLGSYNELLWGPYVKVGLRYSF